MAASESWPWRCACGRLCGKRHTHCPDCKKHWSTGVRHDNTPKSPRAYQQGEQYASWDYGNQTQQRGRPKNRNQGSYNQPERSESGKRKGEGKGKKGKHDSQQPSPFLQPSAIPPWPTLEANPQLAPVAPISPTLVQPNADLVLAVRKQYPDLTQAPEDIQRAMEKAEKTNPKVLATELNKASNQVGKAAKQMAAVREARNAHRQNWLKHLRDSATSWTKQVQQFKDQQNQYGEQLNRAQQDLNTARRNLQHLNKQAAAIGAPTSQEAGDVPAETAENDANAAFEAEAQALAEQVQESLQAAVQAANIPMEVLSDEEEEDRTKKRPRSLEPFANTAPGVLSNALGSTPSS
eukprot:s1573_g7.t1